MRVVVDARNWERARLRGAQVSAGLNHVPSPPGKCLEQSRCRLPHTAQCHLVCCCLSTFGGSAMSSGPSSTPPLDPYLCLASDL